MADKPGLRVHERWARLRFSVIGLLLAAPPENGALRAALEDLAAREWRHPTTGEPIGHASTLAHRCKVAANPPTELTNRRNCHYAYRTI